MEWVGEDGDADFSNVFSENLFLVVPLKSNHKGYTQILYSAAFGLLKDTVRDINKANGDGDDDGDGDGDG